MHREVIVEAASFVLVLAACSIIIFVASQSMPADRRPVGVVVQAVLSTLLALPCGASWRSLRNAIRRREQLGGVRGVDSTRY